MWGGIASCRQCAKRRIGARQRNNRITGFTHCGNCQCAGIGDRRRTCIADQGNRLPRSQKIDEFLRRLPFVMLVQCKQTRGDTVMPQQMRSNARVFSGNHVDAFQYLQRAQRDVGEITNRCRHYI